MDPLDMPRDRWVTARRRSIAAAALHRDGAPMRRIEEAFAPVATGDLSAAQAGATALLAEIGWAEALLAPLLSELAAEPLFEPPLKVSRSAGRVGAVFYDGPAARVTATVLSAGRAPPATTVATGKVAVIHVVHARELLIRRWYAGPFGEGAALAPARPLPPVMPRDGDVVVLDGRTLAAVLEPGHGAAVTITAILHAGTAAHVREFRVSDGAPVRCGTTDEGASRAALMLAFLRASGRRDAGDVFAAATRAPAAHDRWTAMREWLALDADRAGERLAEMEGSDPSDELRALAAATLALVEERRRCRA